MAVQFAVELRNARLAAIETTIGPSPLVRLYTGPPPSTLAAAATGTLLAEIPLPADYFAAPASGVMAMAGTWTTSAIAAGDVGHFRMTTSAGAARLQGTCAESGGDMLVDNATISVGQTVTVRVFTLTDANA